MTSAFTRAKFGNASELTMNIEIRILRKRTPSRQNFASPGRSCTGLRIGRGSKDPMISGLANVCTCFDSRLWTERKEAAQDRFYVSWFILLQSSCFAPHTGMCLKHRAEIPGDVFSTRRRAMIAPCRRERAESLEPELEHAWADYEAPVYNEGFGYEVLVVQGLKILAQTISAPYIGPMFLVTTVVTHWCMRIKAIAMVKTVKC
ncbi:hypothetical protein BDR05DRAFT_988105 [Suillus weaverae]|nr:hypothetical protein BDR05DRAFT_988105 [Suillus weaverae]